MNIVVLIKLVPDLVEELTVDDGGRALDRDWLRLIINEFDDHALEQAILLKEGYGGQVTAIAPDYEGADDVLFAAFARGADRIIKLIGESTEEANNHSLARSLVSIVQGLEPDLILTGVQAHNDLDGSLGPLLAEYLSMPYVGYVSGVSLSNGSCQVSKEYPGGLMGIMGVKLPALLGIQAADQPPRYVAISKVRQAMQSASIEELEIGSLDSSGGLEISRMYKPAIGERAEMIEGDEEEIAARLIEIFQERGLL